MTIDITTTQVTAIVAAAIILIDLVIRVIAVIVVPRNRRPTAGMAWLLAIFFIPILGVLFFLLIGNPKLPKHRREKQAEVDEFIRESTHGVERVSDSTHLAAVVRRGRAAEPQPRRDAAHRLEQREPDRRLRGLARRDDRGDPGRRSATCTSSSTSSPTTETTAPFFDALGEAVARGVEVRVLLDHIASLRVKGYRKTLKRLDRDGRAVAAHAAGAAVQGQLPASRPAQPPQDPRRRRRGRVHGVAEHHRPLLQQARATSVAASSGRSSSCASRARSCRASTPSSRPTGTSRPARRRCARSCRSARRRRRRTSTARWCRAVPDTTNENNLQLFLALMYAAQERIVLTSPYFVPDEAMLRAISGATQRGVHVELFVSEIGDQALVYHAQRSLLRGAAARRREDLAVPGARTSCTPSTSRSTTTSP